MVMMPPAALDLLDGKCDAIVYLTQNLTQFLTHSLTL
jgi:hypothetical protein